MFDKIFNEDMSDNNINIVLDNFIIEVLDNTKCLKVTSKTKVHFIYNNRYII